MSNDKILERVRALLAIAEHPNTPEHEADTALTQANRLMAKHAIEGAMLRATQSSGERRAIERKIVTLAQGDEHEFRVNLRAIMGYVADANRVQCVLLNGGRAELFGMHDDLIWVEQLYTQIYFDFISKLSARWDRSKTYEANVYRLKNAGLKWREINDLSIDNGGPDFAEYEESIWTNEPRKTGKIKGGMIAAYKREIKRLQALDEDVQVIAASNPTQYRRDFAEAFQNRIGGRLYAMKNDSRDESKSSGAELVLSSLKTEIREALYEAYPGLRPPTEAEMLAAEEAERKKRDDMLNAMTDKQRYEFLEKERREEERRAKANAKYWQKKDAGRNWAGVDAGRRAAQSVSLARNAGAARASADRKELS